MESTQINNETLVESAMNNVDDFVVYTTNKLARQTKVISYVDARHEEVVGSYTHYFFTTCFNIKTDERVKSPSKISKSPTKISKKVNKLSPKQPILTVKWDDLTAIDYMMTEAMKTLPEEQRRSKFLRKNIFSSITTGMLIASYRARGINVDAFFPPGVTLGSEEKENSWERDLTCEGIEPNPGPTDVFGCNHKNRQWYFDSYIGVNRYYSYFYVIEYRCGLFSIEHRGSFHCDLCRFRYFKVEITLPYFNEYNKSLCEQIILRNPGFTAIKQEDWIRDLCAEGIESNPGPSELNGDTKRNSKTQRLNVTNLQRLSRLAMRDDKIGKQASEKHSQEVKFRRQEASHKQVMKTLYPETQFTINHNVKLELPDLGILDHIMSVVSSLPDEFKYIIRLADVISSIKVMLFEESYAAKYLAVRALIKEFRVNGVDATTICGTVIAVLSKFGMKTSDLPRTESLNDEINPVSALVTLVLTFMLGGSPRQTRVQHVMRTIGDLPKQSAGFDCLIKVVMKTLEYLKVVSDPEHDVKLRLDKLSAKVAFWLTREGEIFLLTDPNALEQIVDALLEEDDLKKNFSVNHPLLKRHSMTFYHLHKFHRQVLSAPRSGHSYRKEPVVLQLAGPPGVGKTFMVQAIAIDALRHIFKLNGKSEDEISEALSNPFQYVYWRPIGHKYETNYNSAYSKIYVMDDANQVHVDLLRDDLPAPARLIHLKNNADLLLPVAEIENKKLAKFNSDLVIFTDNQEKPDLDYLSDDKAYQRRIDLPYRVTLKPEYLTIVNGVKVIDVTKLNPNEVDTSAWVFTHIDSREKISYSELVSRMCAKLTQMNTNFSVSQEQLVRYAKRDLATVVQESTIPLTEGRTQSLFDDPIEDLEEQNTSDHREVSFVKEMFWSGLTLFSGIGILTGMFLFARDTTRYWMRVKQNYFRFSAYVTFKSVMLFFRVKDWWRQEDSGSNRKKVVWITCGALLSVVSAIVLYRKYKTKQPLYNESYAAGDATVIKPAKPTRIPRGRLIPNPLKEGLKIQLEKATEFANATTQGGFDNNLQHLRSRVLRNQYEITVKDANKSHTMFGLFVAGRVFVVNAHLLKDMCLKSSTFTLRGLYKNIESVSIQDVEIIRLEQDGIFPYDIIFLCFNRNCGVQDHSNISSSIMTREAALQAQGQRAILSTLKMQKDVWFVEAQFSHVSSVKDDYLKSQDADGSITYNYGVIAYDAQTSQGYCGSVLFVNNPKFPQKIAGLHMASFPSLDKCFAAMLTKEMVDCVLESCRDAFYSLETACTLEGKQTVIGNEFEHLFVIPDVLSSPVKTKKKAGLLHNLVFQTTKAPAKLSFHPYEHGKEHVLAVALRKYTGDYTSIHPNDRAIFRGFLTRNFTPTRSLRKLTIEEAIRGIEGDEYFRAINRASSPGYPFVKDRPHGTKGKEYYLGSGEDFIYNHPYLLERMKHYVDTALSNQRPKTVFVTTAKDELRSLDKVANGQTRAFAAAPLDYVVLFRQYYLDFIASMFENRVINSSLMAINPTSSEWTYVATHLCEVTKPDDCGFLAGDFKNFDGTLSQSFLWEIFDFLESLYGRDDMVTRALWHDVTHSIQVFGNTAVSVVRGEPSGFPGTGPVNTLYNSTLLHFVIYKILDERKTMQANVLKNDLKSHLRVICFGDDNVLSLSVQLREEVDPSMLQAKMAQYGHTYTSDRKDGTDLRYVPLSEVSILKRHFVYDPTISLWLAPLDLVSILEPLNWDCESDPESGEKQIQCMENVRNVILNLALHPKDVFESYRKKIFAAIRMLNMEHHHLNLIPHEICYFSQNTLKKQIYELED